MTFLSSWHIKYLPYASTFPQSTVATLFMSSCTTLGDLQQGSAFHKLMVLPTLAPEFACLYYVLGTTDYLAAQAAFQEAATSTDETG